MVGRGELSPAARDTATGVELVQFIEANAVKPADAVRTGYLAAAPRRPRKKGVFGL